MKKLFVGSLAWATDDQSLKEFFEQFGVVTKAEVVRERDSNRSRGFAFVEFEDDAAADKAIAEADGKELDGRAITVNEAQSRGPREGGSNGGGGGYRGGNDRGGNRGGGGGYDNNRGGGGGNSFRSRSW